MTATLVFGGTFDPVHEGHIGSARALLREFDDARLVMVPSQNPPHRSAPGASATDRYEMLKLAVADEENIEADDCELQRAGKSFTWETLLGYRRQLGDVAPLYFVLGRDAFLTLPDWHNWQRLTDLAHLLVLQRPSESAEMPDELAAWMQPRESDLSASLAKPAGQVCSLSLQQFPISASAVRQRLALDQSITDMVPDVVARYIEQHNLYLPPDKQSGERRKHA